uniref:Caenorhabditis elegans ly-6-related family-containing protein n=1 Tax=Parastrongyloides trichosuri TaxID=131310 RepID=A0A0N4ZVU9_PARTI
MTIILSIDDQEKIETIALLKENVRTGKNGLMLPFANLVFVANKISAQLEQEMVNSRKSISYYNTPNNITTNNTHINEKEEDKSFSTLNDLHLDERKLTLTSFKSIILSCPNTNNSTDNQKKKNKSCIVAGCQCFLIFILIIFLLKSHLFQMLGSSNYEKNLILDEEEARQFIRNNGGEKDEHNFKKKFYSVPKQLKCYSCMSLNYQESWDFLQATYEKPHVFTNRCNDQHLMQNMGLVSCNTFCVTLAEPNVEAGVFIGYKYIRGCADKIVKNGFNQTALRTHRFVSTPTCRMLPRALIFNQPKGMDVPVYGDVRLCSCFTDRCNAASNSSSSVFFNSRLPFVISLLHMVFLIILNNYLF